MTDLVIFNILIPTADNLTGAHHPPSKFRTWAAAAAAKFGGLTTMGLGLEGLWYDPDLPPQDNPVRDLSHWYKIGVPEERVDELRAFVRETARSFGQKYLYFERAGEAEFIAGAGLGPSG